MPLPGIHSQVFFCGASAVAYLLRSRSILKHPSFSKILSKQTIPAPASFHQILMAAAAAAAAASSSLNPERSYDVFLSFRGTDVRNNFLSHLYTALDQNGIFTYIDSEELRKGEQISPALMKAIEESHIAIIIFSEDYASSPWCLDELAKIMECKVEKDLVVLPLFYKVEPREVRSGRESYGRAMAKHESKFGKNSEKVNRWKEALFDAGSLSGWDLNDGDEAILVKRIVEEISLQLDREPLHVAKHPVGIHLRVIKLKSMLNLESDESVLMIGLWGQGGIGKTTLAKALYNAIFRQFEGSCFLANVREASRDSKDLVSLQEKLLFNILVRKRLAVTSVDGGINLIQYRLCHKKVLLVLDDVNDVEQLNALAGDCEWFGKGSRIIITTRDSHLLTSHGIDKDHIYEVQTLENHEALELFNKHAFSRNNKFAIQRDLIHSALHYAKGLPLALKVLGSFLCGRGEHEWKSALNKLAKSPDITINNVLKLSYDGLEDYQKEIFLDVACFFKGQYIEDIRKVLDSCDFDATIGVQVLVEKSLIIEEFGKLQMHDLIQLMGMDIVKQECRDDPGRRSRLWLCDDIRDVLSGDMGTDAVKAIVLNLPEPEEIDIDPHAFKNLRRLRLLIMINVHTSFQGPICLPNGLRWFEWPECPWIPEFSSGPKKLVGLDMRKSSIQVVREQFKDYKKLKFINFSECQWVVHMPDLNCTPNLEELNLYGCKNLEHVHESVASHRKLLSLSLGGCSKLERFPDIPDKNESLRDIYLGETSIEELPASIENLVSLNYMSLYGCKKLAILPSTIYSLPNLEELYFDGCSKLIKFPKKEEDSSDPHMKTGFCNLQMLNLNGCNLSGVEFLENNSCFPCLQILSLSENNFTNLPKLEQLYNLERLTVSNCQQLREIPKLPGKLRTLGATNCGSLSKLPSNICDVKTLELYSCQQLIHNGFCVNDLFKLEKFHHQTKCKVIAPGGEMPKWLLPSKEGYISFVATEELYKKILGVAFCVVFRGEGMEGEGMGFFPFELIASVNCKGRESFRFVSVFNSDHVWLEYMESKEVWPVDDFSPNGLSHFHVSVRGSRDQAHLHRRVIVKKCGFRLICKSLENDSEVSLQDNQLLDPALLYEVSHEDSPTSTKENSSSETEDLEDSETWTEKEGLNMADFTETWTEEEGFNMDDFSIEKLRYSRIYPHCRSVRPGGEMPKGFILVEDGTISFMASQDIFDKLLGLVFCVVFGVEDGEKEVSFDIVPCLNGQRRNVIEGTLGSFDSNHTWIVCLKLNILWGVLEGAVDFSQFEEKKALFSLTVGVSGGIREKLGYMLRCCQLEDDLKIALGENQLVDPASIYEDSDAEEETSIGYLRKFNIFQGIGSSDSETD